jgi:uncharacterized membrane protein
MKTTQILLTFVLAVFLAAVTVSAQDVAGVADPVTGVISDSGSGSNGYYKPAGDYYYPAGGYSKPGNDAGGYYSVPEPSTLTLLGIGLAAGLGYRILRKKRG